MTLEIEKVENIPLEQAPLPPTEPRHVTKHSTFARFLSNPVLWEYARWLSEKDLSVINYNPQVFELDKFVASEEGDRKGTLNEIFTLEFLKQSRPEHKIIPSNQACLAVKEIFPQAELEVDGFGFYSLIEPNRNPNIPPAPSPDGAIQSSRTQFIETTITDNPAYFGRKVKQYIRLLTELQAIGNQELLSLLEDPICLFLIPQDIYTKKMTDIRRKIATDPECQFEGRLIADFEPLPYTSKGFKHFFTDYFSVTNVVLKPSEDRVFAFPKPLTNKVLVTPALTPSRFSFKSAVWN